MYLIYEITANQQNLFREMINITKFTFKTIQNLISEKKIYSISTESVIKLIKSYNEGNIFFI